jgi:hypothetical protein
MNTIKQLFKATLLAGLAITAVSCSKDKTENTTVLGDKVYTLGLGVTTASTTTNYVVATSNLMTGTISLTNNGVLQSGYRDYALGGSTFFSVGGLGITDVNAITLDASNKLSTRTGLTFESAAVDFKDVDGTGKTMLGVSVPASPTAGLSAQFFTVDVATNAIASKVNVLMNNIHPSNQDWFLHTGIEVRGNQAFQTFYPINYSNYVTANTDTAYVAIYSFPGFVLQKVIKDARTGPAGSFGTQSGIFKTEAGDLYTVAHNGYGYSKATKAAGILKIAAGATEFDQSYYFNTATATNGGKIVHAKYIGNNKLFAEISSTADGSQWADAGLKFAIVDLSAKTITAVTNSPTFTGNGGRSFAAVLDEGKIYVAAAVDNVTNIYQVDVASATATKGAIIDATFLGGIARLK